MLHPFVLNELAGELSGCSIYKTVAEMSNSVEDFRTTECRG